MMGSRAGAGAHAQLAGDPALRDGAAPNLALTIAPPPRVAQRRVGSTASRSRGP